MNQSFVCIKVDREERPDLDEIYMQATLAMNQGNGGWPMTVFLTPDQQPIFAGTYFPPTDRWGRPGFATVLKKISEGWEKDESDILASARASWFQSIGIPGTRRPSQRPNRTTNPSFFQSAIQPVTGATSWNGNLSKTKRLPIS